MGNGGYASLHTDLFLDYDAIANLFLPGTHANLQVRSTQCLSDLSFDFISVSVIISQCRMNLRLS